jgi:tRNA(Ile)-lysidine synthase
MLPSSGVPEAPAQRLIRPLLTLTRTETVEVCRRAGIEPLADASNEDVTILRNRLRRETLPALREINPSVERALTGLAASARELFEATERESYSAQPASRGAVGSMFPLEPLARLSNEALTLVIEREAAFASLSSEVNRTRLRDAREVLRRGTGKVQFGEAVLEASAGMTRIGPVLSHDEFEGKVLNVPGATIVGPWRVEVATSPLPEQKDAQLFALDREGVRGVLRGRPLAAGDRMTYHGIRRKVADVFANEKVPAWERRESIAIADGNGVLAVVAGGRAFAAGVKGEEDALYVRLKRQSQPASHPRRL